MIGPETLVRAHAIRCPNVIRFCTTVTVLSLIGATCLAPADGKVPMSVMTGTATIVALVLWRKLSRPG